MQHRRRISLIGAALILCGSFASFALLTNPVYAAQRTAYIDLTGQPGTAPSTVAAPPEVAISTADEFYISYVSSATEFANTNTITINVPVGFTGVATCSSPTTDADGDATPDGSVGVAGQTVTYTFSASTTDAATTGVEICFAATSPGTAGNYSVAISDTNDNDSSAALIYVGDANDVTVTATVAQTLSLRIKNPTTTADTNVCALGVLNPASVNTCTYRIAAGTNIASGMNVQIIADNQLNTAGDTADINDINTGVNTAIDAGVEEYGNYVSAAGAVFSIGTGYNVYNDIPTVADAETQEEILTVASTVDDSNTANWATITHGASINTGTAGGSYDQLVTYRAYANI